MGFLIVMAIIIGSIIGIMILIGPIVMSYKLHKLKGHGDSFSFIWAILLGVIYLLYSVGLPVVSQSCFEDDDTVYGVPKGEEITTCPECGNQIFEDETICSNCGYEKGTD